MRLLPLFFLSGIALFGQSQTTGTATTTGTCSPATTGAGNSFNFTCSGLTPPQQKLLESIPALLNKLLDSRTGDTSEILSRLDTCVAGVNQVREQQTAWHMTDKQRTDLQALLSSHHAEVSVHVIAQDRNAALFGQDLLAALKGYTTITDLGKTFSTDFRLNPQIEGIVVIVAHPDFPEAGFLQKSMNAALGMAIQGEVDTKGEFVKGDSIIIAVGAKPSH